MTDYRPIVLRLLPKMNPKVRYWTSLAEYDIETAGAMLRTGRFLYVGFMCHQAVEKMLKAAWPLNVEARYPSHKNALMKKLTKRYCTALVGGLISSASIRSWTFLPAPG